MKGKNQRIVFATATALGLLLSASCRKPSHDSAWHVDERVRVELEQHLRLLTYRFESRGGNLPGDLAEAVARTGENDRTIETLESRLASLEKEIEDQLAAHELRVLQDAREARQAAALSEFETFVTADGSSYHDVVVTEVTAGGVAIRHKSGTARFRPTDLTSQQQEFFGVSTEAAEREARIELQNALAYERRLEAHLRHATPARSAPEPARTSRRLALANRANSLHVTSRDRSTRPLAQPAKPFGTGSIYRTRRSSYRTRYYNVYPCVPYPYRYGTITRSQIRGLYEWRPGSCPP